jgi:hypothetical protein
MRVLTHGFEDNVEDVVALLDQKGIPTFTRRGRDGVMVYVCLPRHYEDAFRLLKDPDHVVKEPVDVQAFREAAANQGVDPLFRLLLPLLGVVLVLFGVFVWFYFR